MLLLTDIEVRVLGSLIEKQMTTPDYYPMTLNGLCNACNQKSNRDPAMVLEERVVLRALDTLREKKLAAMIHQASSRVPKYEHRMDEVLGLGREQLAIMCELMVRGPQTVGELRGHCRRLWEFSGLEDVEEVVRELARRNEGQLVKQLPLQPGRKEPRYAQLLAGEPEIEMAEATPREAIRVTLDAEDERVAELDARVTALEGEVVALRDELAAFKAQFE